MPDYFYAQINESGRVIGISQLAQEVKSEYMIPITKEQFDNQNMLFTRYDGGSFAGTSANIEADKPVIAPNGTDVMTVKVRVADWNDKPQGSYSENVIIEVNGLQQSVKAVGGVAELSLSSSEPGEFHLRTVNLDRNAEIKVVVSDEF
ncbi:hypothetical protein [Paenibacillus arenilitoris]|uniref:Uncharacterized protein n=1 Tax=Paenibacillus arenilitoris TaxID=2772299 RepID=A0A927CKV0_9BACL|nr:hypothetical protein [Paenibacillus arenilitoris]MBD2867731.1 hypothetical protein [Paenibacillus arenilitoris]